MSALAIVALVLACVWLGVLTFVVVLLVRQVGLLTVRLSMATQAISLDDDGPEVGSILPEDVAEVMPDGERAYLLLISASCEPCRELVVELDGHQFEQSVVALVPGRQEQASELAALLPRHEGRSSIPRRPSWPSHWISKAHRSPSKSEGGTVTSKGSTCSGAHQPCWSSWNPQATRSRTVVS